MNRNLSIVLLAAALALLAGCTTAPTSPAAATSTASAASNASGASPTSGVSSTTDTKIPGSAGASSPLPLPDDLNQGFNPGQNLAGGPLLKELERGQASWYGPRFHGRRTASGERYDQHAMTAAHKTLPFGTLVRVRSLVTGKEVDVRVTDRGPFVRGRVIDVSRAAAQALGMMGLGVKQVSLHVADSGSSLVGATRTREVPTRSARAAENSREDFLLSDRLDYPH
jgi:rare lipoprotein A